MLDDDNRPIKRAPVVYGKRSSLNPPRSPVVSPGEQTRPFEHAHHSPSQPSKSARSLNASDTECTPTPDADSSFQFGFRHKLRELDEQFEDRDAQSRRAFSHNKGEHADLPQVKDLQSVPMGTAMLSFEVPHVSEDLSRSSSSPLSSLPTASTQEYPPDSPPVHRRVRRPHNPIPSDSEAEEPSSSSSPSPLRHVITTPHSRSSPTPPTSGELAMPGRKAKGKVPARDVLPLFFDGKGPSPAETSKPKRRRRSESLPRTKTKAPTKKERQEAAFESSRIAASRPVEVRRTQEQKYNLSTFFTNLRRDNIATTAFGTELPSDPIERFSSPTDKSTRAEPGSAFGKPTGPLAASPCTGRTSRPSSSGNSKVLPPAAADSDDEMASITSIVQQAGGKQQRLHAIKQVALQHADTYKTVDNHSEDDDLLIVKDDMHSVVRQEAFQRRLDKANGSPVKDQATLRRLNHPSLRPVTISPRKLSKQELQELAKPSFVRAGKRVKGQLNKNQLDQLMMTKHVEEQLKSIKRQEEEWVKRGGRLSRNTGDDDARKSLSQTVGAYAAEGLKAVEVVDAAEEEGSDGSDEDYIPNSRSASPEPVEESDMQDDNVSKDVSSIPRPPGGDYSHGEDDEIIALRRNKYGLRRPRIVVGSDDEEMQPSRQYLPAAQRDSASSMEGQTEDETDKENKAVVHHEPVLSTESMFDLRRLGSLQSIEDGTRRNPSLALATSPKDIIGSPNGNVRSSLKNVSRDEKDFFSSPSKPLFAGDRHLRSATRSPPHASTSTRSLGFSPTLRSERINRMARFSLDSRNDENDPSGFKVSHPSFLERLQSQSSPEPSLPCFNPLTSGGLSQLFDAEEEDPKRSIDTTLDGLALTLDVGLKPALEVSSTLKRKAEAIFEKEQEYVVAAAVQQNNRLREVLYINDHGFLTQTCPEGSSPQIYRTTPSQATKFIGTQVQSPQTQSLGIRPPLRTLSFTASQETSPEPQPLRRLHRRSLSPLEHKITGKHGDPVRNAFTILGKARESLSKEQNKKHEKSEFVAAEAEESDEDGMFGFGGPKADEEEEDDNEQDKVVEGLVDDTLMDAETEAADLVQEKFREHEEEDDQRLQKLHEDATKGKFRTKRRDRGVGFEDESDDDDDDDERRIRRRMSKRRKIQDDNLEALGQNEETKAFYDTYHQDLIDMDDEFGYLQRGATIPQDDGDAQAEEPQETVSADEIRRRVREVAENNYEVEVLDPEDISWVDQAMDMEADDSVPVKTVESRRSKHVHRANAGHMEFNKGPSTRTASEQEKRMTYWAKNQSRQQHGTARSGNTTAVTGHARAKSGGGSLRSTQPSKPAVSTAHTTKTASLLSMVSNRSSKFS